MRHPWLILLGAVALGLAVFAGGYLLAERCCLLPVARSVDNLEWLRLEFHLGEVEMARIRELHAGYLPICQGYCERIAAKKADLRQALSAGSEVPARAEQDLVQIGVLRAECEAAMLRYFAKVSRAMPPAEGRRYLAEMRKLTLDFHPQIEASMAPRGAGAHGHH